MKKYILFLFVFLFTIGIQAQDKQKVKLANDKKTSAIYYSMHHPLHAWDAESKDVNSVILTDDAKSTIYQVAVSVKITSFDSKNANRDSHTIEVTDAIKYPNVTFASTSITQNGDNLNVTGKLTFHGVTKPLTVKCDMHKHGDKIEVTGKFTIKMTDFKIDPPSLLAIPTDDEIKMSFDIFF